MDNSVELGFVIAAPIMAIAGLGFAISTSASPFITRIGKAIMWPAAVIMGVVGADYWADTLLPDWPEWLAQATMFGPGWFFTIMFCAIVFGEEAVIRQGQLVALIGRGIKSLIEKMAGGPRKKKTKVRVDLNTDERRS